MPQPQDLLTVVESQQRLSKLEQLFQKTDGQIVQGLARNDYESCNHCISDLKLFQVLLSNYQHLRWQKTGILSATHGHRDLREVHLLSLSNIRRLEKLLEELQECGFNDRNGTLALARWKSVAKTFWSLMDTETRFLDRAKQDALGYTTT